MTDRQRGAQNGKVSAPPRRRRSLPVRIAVMLAKLVLAFVITSLLLVLLFRFVNPPITLTMLGDMVQGHGVTKRWMPIERIDRTMPRAVIAAEDARFCQHDGFDFDAIQAAYRRNQSGKRIRGGSTISQQTAKNVFLWQGGGYARKGLEAWFTVLIENIWGKRRIMEVYLNVAETGIGTYGVNAGSLRYFKHDASRMSTREAAQIAAVLPLPKKRAGIAPRGYTRRYGNSITARIGVVRNDGLDACLR
jgi:monofunctional biosynthetic peptidoglycan transglycosylase